MARGLHGLQLPSSLAAIGPLRHRPTAIRNVYNWRVKVRGTAPTLRASPDSNRRLATRARLATGVGALCELGVPVSE